MECSRERTRINGEKPRKHGLIFCASSSRQRTHRGARDRGDGGGSRVFRRRPCVRVRLRRGKPVRTVRFGVFMCFVSVWASTFFRNIYIFICLLFGVRRRTDINRTAHPSFRTGNYYVRLKSSRVTFRPISTAVCACLIISR